MVIWSEIDPVLVLHVVVGTVLPFLVGLVTTKLTPGWQKGLLLVGFTLATNVGAEAAEALAVGLPFRVVDAVVFSAAQLAYSVALHKSVIAPGPVADWLATHVRKADPNQVLLIEQGWQGPLPTVEEAANVVKAAGAAVEVKRVDGIVAVKTPDVIAQGSEVGLPWSHPDADPLGDIAALREQALHVPLKEWKPVVTVTEAEQLKNAGHDVEGSGLFEVMGFPPAGDPEEGNRYLGVEVDSSPVPESYVPKHRGRRAAGGSSVRAVSETEKG